MDDAAVTKARRQVALLMVPVVLIALLVATLIALGFWGFAHPSSWGI
ncbi:MAG: hypothetical protein JOZ75_08045 [Candidatus Dormibacteraeota bacterium]|nr:hypothetical protein [Candidatus Dormibacteraeota bacterium]